MNTKSGICDNQRNDAFLDFGHISFDDPLLVAHLDTGEACRNYIEAQAAEADRSAKATETPQL